MAQIFLKKPVLRELDIMETELLNIRANKELHGLNINDHKCLKNVKNDLKSLIIRMANNLKDDIEIKDSMKSVEDLIKEIELSGNDVLIKKEERPIMLPKNKKITGFNDPIYLN